jgi:tetratricopeptide (TPR) repeat protein
MSFEQIKEFFKNLELWQKVAAGLIVAATVALIGLLWRIIKRIGRGPDSSAIGSVSTVPHPPTQVATGDGITQNIVVDKSIDRGVHITVEPGAQAVINVMDYQDGISQSTIPNVKSLFEEARNHYIKRQFIKAIEKFKHCLDLEKDAEKRGALNLQIGNCYYDQQRYLKAAEYYGAGLIESRKANDKQGQATNLVSIANTYLLRPASSGSARGNNVRQAVNNYKNALQIFDKDEYPVQYATTQNNLGTAYTDLPAATPEQRAQNVRNAIDCYKAALEIRKKDEYPQDYCFTAANMGIILEDIDNKKACYWLKEAYSLRQFLPDQGKRIEDVMKRVCD